VSSRSEGLRNYKGSQGAGDVLFLLCVTTLKALKSNHALPIVPPVNEIRLSVPTIGTVGSDYEGVQLGPIPVSLVQNQIAPR